MENTLTLTNGSFFFQSQGNSDKKQFLSLSRQLSFYNNLCNPLFLQNLFGNKTAGFGATTTSTPSFGTGTGLFGNKPALTLGAGTNTSTFGMLTSDEHVTQTTAVMELV